MFFIPTTLLHARCPQLHLHPRLPSGLPRFMQLLEFELRADHQSTPVRHSKHQFNILRTEFSESPDESVGRSGSSRCLARIHGLQLLPMGELQKMMLAGLCVGVCKDY